MKVNKPKKIIDWIKFRNIKEVTINNSALKGLKKINSLLSRFIKVGIIGFLSYNCFKLAINHFEDVFYKNIEKLENEINKLDEDRKKYIYLQNHIKLSLEYGNSKRMDDIEKKTGIAYYREKLLKNASGLILETCCGSFRNKQYYNENVKNVRK